MVERHFEPTCCNCKKARYENSKHKASSLLCPHYKAGQDKPQKSILYYSKNI